MKTLQQIWNDLPVKSDKGDIHSYIPVYEEILAPYRTTAKNILEIGLFNGASLMLWEQYFAGKVYGIDCDEQPHGGMADLRPMILSGEHNIIIGDATSEADIEKFFGNIKWDVVFDDGSHDLLAQLQTFRIFKNKMNKGGIVIIEDIQNLERDRWAFESLKGQFSVEIIDRRKIKQRYDDVMVVIKPLLQSVGLPIFPRFFPFFGSGRGC